jgi:hypothetical protein
MVEIEVKRIRPSVTQGEADVYINGEKIISFGDTICLKQNDDNFTDGFRTFKNVKHYGEVIGGWGSIKPDSDFILGLLYHPFDNVYHYSDKFKEAILKADNK